MNKYKLTVGLEIHAELNTRTKMFCDSLNDPNESRPNINVCPVCMGHPGTLPVINKEAIKKVITVGKALKGEIADYTEFDRKNYFYPDIPKGYQLSQYKHPLVSGGELASVGITRIHLEEDTARSTHDKGAESLVDFNRAGVPLMELVTEPVIHDALTAAKFCKELQLLITCLGVGHANLEKGEMRFEANVSVSRFDLKNPNSKVGSLGTKVEVKNLNSFRAVEKAIKFEFKRQTELLERGEKVTQETRGWNSSKEETFSQRAKEESYDYRYFPDPDLPKIFVSEVEEFKIAFLPELPQEKRDRFKKDYGLKDEDIEIYVKDQELGNYFEEVAKEIADPKLYQLASNFITTDLKGLIPPSTLVEVARMNAREEISSRSAKDILKIIQENGGELRKIVEGKNLLQISDREILKKFVEEVLRENNNAPLPFLVGQALKKSGGRGNPKVLQELLLEMLH